MRVFRKIIRELFPFYFKKFKNTHDYWDKRYKYGGNSGGGSYGQSALNKASYLNRIMKKYELTAIIELGSGDGNNALLYDAGKYFGFDISPHSIALARDNCKDKVGYKFFQIDDGFSETITAIKSENKDEKFIIISFDVIFHLIEQDTYESYLNSLDLCADNFILVLATDFDGATTVDHVVNRHYSKYLSNLGWKNIPEETVLEEGEKRYKLFTR